VSKNLAPEVIAVRQLAPAKKILSIDAIVFLLYLTSLNILQA
jgi:hypothetical protein